MTKEYKTMMHRNQIKKKISRDSVDSNMQWKEGKCNLSTNWRKKTGELEKLSNTKIASQQQNTENIHVTCANCNQKRLGNHTTKKANEE